MKNKKSASASSSDIETEPKGKRNGTATPQNELSESKSSKKDGVGQISIEENRIADEIADAEALKDEFAKNALENFDDNEYNGNIADEKALRNERRIEKETGGKSERETRPDKATQPQGEGGIDGGRSEIQPGTQPGEGRRDEADADRQGIRLESGLQIPGRHAELGGASGAEGGRPDTVEVSFSIYRAMHCRLLYKGNIQACLQ